MSISVSFRPSAIPQPAYTPIIHNTRLSLPVGSMASTMLRFSATRDGHFPDLVKETLSHVSFKDLLPPDKTLTESMLSNLDRQGRFDVPVFSTPLFDKPLQNTKLPLVSIVIPVYNLKKFIHETLESIAKQDYANKEIIVLDDGSTDNSTQVIKAFMQQHANSLRVKLVQLPHAGSPAVGRNVGTHRFLSNQSQVITFMDGDDCYHQPELLRALVHGLQQNPNAFFALGDFAWMNEQGKIFLPAIYSKVGKNHQRIWKAQKRLDNWDNIFSSQHN